MDFTLQIPVLPPSIQLADNNKSTNTTAPDNTKRDPKISPDQQALTQTTSTTSNKLDNTTTTTENMTGKFGQPRKGQTIYTHSDLTNPDTMLVNDLPRGWPSPSRAGSVSPHAKGRPAVVVHKPSGPVNDEGPRRPRPEDSGKYS